MITLIALIIAIILQFAGALVAIGSIRMTKKAISWILLSVGFLLMAIQRFIEFIPYVWREWEKDVAAINTWLGIITSVLIAIGIILIRQIFDFLRKVEKQRQEADKKVLNAVIQAEEKERRRLAKDLHDGMGPLLSSAKMAISSLSQHENDNDKIKIIENADYVISEAIRSLKEISNNLSPHVLDNFGLASAIKSFASKVANMQQINVHFESNMFDFRFDYNKEVILYRVACELINNTLKHAQASNIHIQLSRHNKLVSLNYTDDGKGFEVNDILHKSHNEGMGLHNIMNRLKGIKAIVNIDSEKGKGMKVIIIVNI
ncbi:MAG: histidine kinase [Bacteroidales bacterium]|nr:histidine kinase [Bacteroidales bacterium]